MSNIYDKFMKEYKILHKCCPQCGSDGGFSTTLMGYMFYTDDPSSYQDKNACKCMSCGDHHIYHDRIPKK